MKKDGSHGTESPRTRLSAVFARLWPVIPWGVTVTGIAAALLAGSNAHPGAFQMATRVATRGESSPRLQMSAKPPLTLACGAGVWKGMFGAPPKRHVNGSLQTACLMPIRRSFISEQKILAKYWRVFDEDIHGPGCLQRWPTPLC